MSGSKQSKDWTDFLGTSEMPADEMTFTDGSNYGLDGFQFDTPENEGVLDAARLPEISGLSGLPDGFVQAAVPGLDINEVVDDPDSGFNLREMLSAEEGGPLLSEGQQKEASLADLDWLDPTQSQDPDRLPKDLVPDKPPLNSVPELEEAWGANRRTDGLHLVPNKDLEAVRYEESLQAGPHSELPGNKAAEAFRRAVRLAHYGVPMQDIKRDLVAQLGHGASRLRKAVAQLESEWGLLGKVFVRASAFPGLRNGKWAKELKRTARTARYVVTNDEAVAVKLSKEMVAEVPWKEALAYYRPRLKAAGFKVAAKGNSRVVLQRALVGGVRFQRPAPAPKPEGVVLAKAPDVPSSDKPIQSSEQQAVARKMKAALSRVARWVKAGKLSQVDAMRLFEQSKTGGVSPEGLLKTAADLATTAPEASTYEGTGTQVTRQAQDSNRNWLPLDTEMQRVVAAASSSGVRAGEVLGLLRWARMQMSEGLAGKELDALLGARFSQPLLAASAELLGEAREAHEGLAGRLYVDAAAYASSAGTSGCEKGALRHRANALKHILAMERCAACTSNSDGMCQKYNKRLADAAPVDNPKAFQKEALKLADAPDSAQTAALFDPSEYQLDSDPLSTVELDPDLPAQTLAEVLFGEGPEL